MKRWVWLALVGVLALAAGVIALQGTSGEGHPPAATQESAPAGAPSTAEGPTSVLVEGVAVERRSIAERASYHGTLQPRRSVVLTPKTGGRVAQVLADVGDQVDAGQVLIRLEATEAEAQLRQAEAALAAARAQHARLVAGATQEEMDQVRAALRQATLQFESAQKELQRIEELYQKGGVSTQTYDSTQTQAALAEAQLRSAEAQLRALESGARPEDLQAAEAQALQAEAGLELARTQVENAAIKAPFAGVVSQRSAEVGALVAPGTPAVTLADLEELKIVLRLPGREVLSLRPDLPAQVTVEGLNQDPFQGRIHQIDPVADPQTNLFGVEVRVSDPQNRLRAGLSATVELALRQVEDVLAVPIEALLERNDQTGVYVVEDGVARFQPVELGLRGDFWQEVRSGLREGETVVTTGKEFLEPGSAVELATAPDLSARSSRVLLARAGRQTSHGSVAAR